MTDDIGLHPTRSQRDTATVRHPSFTEHAYRRKQGDIEALHTEVPTRRPSFTEHAYARGREVISAGESPNTIIDKKWREWSTQEHLRHMRMIESILDELPMGSDNPDMFPHLSVHLFQGARVVMQDCTVIIAASMSELDEKLHKFDPSALERITEYKVKELEKLRETWKIPLETSLRQVEKTFRTLFLHAMLNMAAQKDRILNGLNTEQREAMHQLKEELIERPGAVLINDTVNLLENVFSIKSNYFPDFTDSTVIQDENPKLLDTIISQNPHFKSASIPKIPQYAIEAFPVRATRSLDGQRLAVNIDEILEKQQKLIKSALIKALNDCGEANTTSDTINHREERQLFARIVQSVLDSNKKTYVAIGNAMIDSLIQANTIPYRRTAINLGHSLIALQWSGIAALAISIAAIYLRTHQSNPNSTSGSHFSNSTGGS